jgi:hypothetical protein
MSPELETLDQLLGGELPLFVIRPLFSDDERFLRGILALLNAGDITIRDDMGAAVANWQWRERFDDQNINASMPRLTIAITEQGAKRLA